MKILIFALAMIAAPTARADLYSERESVYARREKIAEQRELQQAINKRWAIITERTRSLERLMQGFIRAHGGLTSESVCSVSVPDCISGDYCRSGEQQPLALSQVRSAAVALRSCNVNLHDGLACSLSQDYNTEAFRMVASCYDENSNYRSFTTSGAAMKPAVKKRRPN